MNIIFISVILLFQPLLHSAMLICPKSFSCLSFSSFKYPFYNANYTQCGLIKVNCTPLGGEIQLGGRSYPIWYKLDSNSSFIISNSTFENLVKKKSCEALMDNFTSPTPLLFSLSISHNFTVFKCKKNLSYTRVTDAYFERSHFSLHNECKDHNFYYKHPNNDSGVPSDLPRTCQVIQLPLKQSWQFGHENMDKADIYRLLPSDFSISFPLSASCEKCLKNGSHCQNRNGQIQCLDVKMELPNIGHKVIPATTDAKNTISITIYKYLINNATVPSNLPHICQVIRLPVKRRPWEFQDHVPDEVTLLSFQFSISFKLSTFCDKCHKNNSQSHTKNNGIVECLLSANNVPAEKKDSRLTLIVVLAGFAFILIVCLVIFIIWRCYKSNHFSYFSSKHKSPIFEDGSLFLGVSVFSYSELEDATKNFDPSHELGDGGFGAVYYGKLQDGREVAVKRLYEHNYKRLQQFLNEVEILTQLHHPNLVLLYGCTSRQSRELLLVYEYISNGTVADHLHGEHKNPSLLKWPIRMSIAKETASALVYLHANEIIHRDIKTNNILLDHNFSVKVADFGLSRLIPNNVTHVSTAPQGTPGYMDPEYHLSYQLTDKSDVYSFGVVLIELISSMVAIDFNRSRDEMILANLALNLIQKGSIDQLVDPVLGYDSDDEIKRMITSVAELAFQCLQFDSEMRPTMNEVLAVLVDIQTDGRPDAHEGIRDTETLKPPPPSETSDQEALLKDSLSSPVSIIISEWQSDDSASTTQSNGDRLPMKNHISI